LAARVEERLTWAVAIDGAEAADAAIRSERAAGEQRVEALTAGVALGDVVRILRRVDAIFELMTTGQLDEVRDLEHAGEPVEPGVGVEADAADVVVRHRARVETARGDRAARQHVGAPLVVRRRRV